MADTCIREELLRAEANCATLNSALTKAIKERDEARFMWIYCEVMLRGIPVAEDDFWLFFADRVPRAWGEGEAARLIRQREPAIAARLFPETTMAELKLEGTRYLQPGEKQYHLDQWDASPELWDVGSRDLLLPLNAIDGVCTVQSCIGHVRDGYVQTGVIELRLDRFHTSGFYVEMSKLALNDWEEVSLSWRPGYQIAIVRFRPGAMDDVVAALLKAFGVNKKRDG